MTMVRLYGVAVSFALEGFGEPDVAKELRLRYFLSNHYIKSPKVKNITILIAVLLLSFRAFAQDMITETNGDEISCHIVKITSKNIKFRPVGREDTGVISIPKRMVFTIKYQTGLEETLNETHVDDNDPDGHWNKQSMAERAKQDAWNNYHGYHGAAAGTFWTCFVTGGLFGLIPAITTSAHAPKDNHLNEPDPELMKNDEYRKAYRKQAHTIKTRKVWGAYAGGTILGAAVIIAIVII